MTSLQDHADKATQCEIILRPLRVEDINDEYVSWFYDQEVTQFLETSNIKIDDAINHLNYGLSNQSYFMYAIIDSYDNSHIGNFKIGPINWVHYVSDMSIIIGNKKYWGKGVAKKAIEIATDIAFQKYNMRKVCAGIIEGNIGSQKALISNGYKVEWRQVRHVMVNGELRDRIVFTKFNENFSRI